MASWVPNQQQSRTPSPWAGILLVFIVGVVLTTSLLVIAGLRG